MPRLPRFLPLFAVLLLFVACADSDPSPPGGPDRGAPDLSSADLLAPDAPTPDVRPTPDLPPPDLGPDQGPLCPDGGPAPDFGVAQATVSGDVFSLTGSPWRVSGARVWVLEHPCRRAVSDDKAHFQFTGLPVGQPVTLVMSHPDFHPLQTGTHILPAGGMQRFTFQAVNHMIFKAFGALAGATPDPSRCQIAATVTRVGKSVYDSGHHGEAGATVSISPALPAAHGPIYFTSSTLPDPKLSETTEDGGVTYVNVPPGTYTLTAKKSGVTFRPVTITCRPGILVNASPPWGLQALP